MNQWQPIETAPKWCWVLVTWHPRSWQPAVKVAIFGRRDFWEDGSERFIEPTHWMPLPEPPNDDTSSR